MSLLFSYIPPHWRLAFSVQSRSLSLLFSSNIFSSTPPRAGHSHLQLSADAQKREAAAISDLEYEREKSALNVSTLRGELAAVVNKLGGMERTHAEALEQLSALEGDKSKLQQQVRRLRGMNSGCNHYHCPFSSLILSPLMTHFLLVYTYPTTPLATCLFLSPGQSLSLSLLFCCNLL